MKDIIDMVREAGVRTQQNKNCDVEYLMSAESLQFFADLVRADELSACAKKTEEFARKWWKIHCDSNLHSSSTLKAHQDFCALQAAIRARGKP
jgi:hypothetical protein